MMKKRNQKGFTLMEMLIVVAIVAILVAISIPVFTSQLENAREATDAANVRAAKAIAVATYLSDGTTGSFKYDADAGKLVATTETVAGYGKGTGAGDDTNVNTDLVVTVTIGADGTTTCAWG